MTTNQPISKAVRQFALLGTVVVLLLSIFVWAQGISFHFGQVDAYAFFPLLGMLAFSTMWLQIVTVCFMKWWKANGLDSDRFLRQSGLFVLILIITHPLTLTLAQKYNGAGLPVQSLYAYLPAMQHVFITYALVALTIFLASEVASHLQGLPFIKKSASFIEYANYIGFFLVFIHSLSIGTNLQGAWFRDIWWFYGVTALLMLAYKAYQGMQSSTSSI